jgi:hypothetical protein
VFFCDAASSFFMIFSRKFFHIFVVKFNWYSWHWNDIRKEGGKFVCNPQQVRHFKYYRFFLDIIFSSVNKQCFTFFSNTHWHVSTVFYKWWHLADCKLLQFIIQQKNYFVNKRACVTNSFGRKTTDGISCVP